MRRFYTVPTAIALGIFAGLILGTVLRALLPLGG